MNYKYLMKVSLIIPAKNEKESLGKVLTELKQYSIVNDIIIIVDSKKDNSIKIAKKFNTKIIVQKKSGYGNAIIEGFKFAKNKYGFIFNADYSFDPKYLKLMLSKKKKNNFIFGSRYMKTAGSDDDSLLTFIGNKIFTFMSRNLLKIKLSDVLYTYVMCDVKIFRTLKFNSRDFRFCVELPFQIEKNKYNYSEIPAMERKRFDGKKNVNEFKDGFLILLEIMRNIFIK